MEWDSENKLITAKIAIDPRKDAPVTLILHELMHIWLAINLNIHLSEKLEEELVLSLEKSLFDYLRLPKNEHLLQSWTDAIKRKLGE